jgi:F0F1-type ATP synthase assembly protein I
MPPPIPTDRLRTRATDRLMPHGSGGLRASLAGVVDLDALEQERYEEVIESVDARLSTAQYSLVSMLVAGIYFGLLVGDWLVSTASWGLIGRWVVPVILVTVYAVYSSYTTVREIRELSEARSLLLVLDQQSTSPHT